MTEKFNPDQLPFENPKDIRKVALITGANSGLGYYASLHLYLHGWIVYMACRDESKCKNAMKRIYKESQGRYKHLPHYAVRGELILHKVDFTQLIEVENSAKEFLKIQESTLDLLINNAGVMALPAQLTADGYDIQIQTNHIGPYLFTRLLLPLIEKSDNGPRIVFVSSIGHHMATPTVDLSQSYARFPNILWTWARYGNSKTANIHTAKMLSRQYPKILSMAVHPGFSLLTGLLTYWTSIPYIGILFLVFFQLFNAFFGVSQEELSYSVLKAGLSEDFSVEKNNGGYLITYGHVGEPSSKARDIELARKTWNWTEQELNKKGYLLS